MQGAGITGTYIRYIQITGISLCRVSPLKRKSRQEKGVHMLDMMFFVLWPWIACPVLPSSCIHPPLSGAGTLSRRYNQSSPMGSWGKFDMSYRLRKTEKAKPLCVSPIIGLPIFRGDELRLLDSREPDTRDRKQRFRRLQPDKTIYYDLATAKSFSGIMMTTNLILFCLIMFSANPCISSHENMVKQGEIKGWNNRHFIQKDLAYVHVTHSFDFSLFGVVSKCIVHLVQWVKVRYVPVLPTQPNIRKPRLTSAHLLHT